MKRIFTRGLSLLLALTAACSLVCGALAQTIEQEKLPTTPEPVVQEEDAPATTEESGEEASQEGEQEDLPDLPVVLTPSGTFSEGMIRVTDGTLWGYQDAAGTVTIPVQFDAAGDFSLGMAKVVLNGKAGLLHWNGDFLLEPEYDELTEVSGGVYLGRRGQLWDLLYINAFSSDEELTHKLYSDLTSATLSTGIMPWLTLVSFGNVTTRLPVSSLPQLLAERRAPGWQFPLSARQAAFQDVTGSDWYDLWVDVAYSTGLMQGIGNNTFEPLRTLTVAEALHMAACLESRAIQDDFHLQGSTGVVWYSASVAYCEAVGIISQDQFSQSDYDRPITRAEMAYIFSGTTPVRSISHRNDLSRVQASVPDVQSGDFAANAVYGLYAKGILNGSDDSLSFRPDDSLTRAEAAAVVSRIARPEQRITLW